MGFQMRHVELTLVDQSAAANYGDSNHVCVARRRLGNAPRCQKCAAQGFEVCQPCDCGPFGNCPRCNSASWSLPEAMTPSNREERRDAQVAVLSINLSAL